MPAGLVNRRRSTTSSFSTKPSTSVRRRSISYRRLVTEAGPSKSSRSMSRRRPARTVKASPMTLLSVSTSYCQVRPVYAPALVSNS